MWSRGWKDIRFGEQRKSAAQRLTGHRGRSPGRSQAGWVETWPHTDPGRNGYREGHAYAGRANWLGQVL